MIGVLVAAIAVMSLASPSEGQALRRLSFADVAAFALTQNLELRAAALEVAAAEAQLAQARGGAQPQVTLQGMYTRSGDRPAQTLSIPNPFGPIPPIITVTLPPPDPNQVAVRVSAQYPLYTGGRIESQIALADATVRLSRAVFERTQQIVLFSAQEAYLEALLAEEQVSAALRRREQAEESLRVARVTVAAGAAPQIDVLQAQLATATAEQELVKAQTARQLGQTALNALLNLPLETRLEYADTLEPRPVAGTLEAAISRAVRSRPELAEVRARIDAARTSIELAASGARPNVAVAGNYDVGGTPSTLGGTWSVVLSVALSLYDGGITRERIREAEYRLAQLRLLEARTAQRIELDVRQAWLMLGQADGELAAAGQGVELAREALRIARIRYQAGVGTSLEILSAQSAFAQSELALAAARFNQNLGRMRLIFAGGGSL